MNHLTSRRRFLAALATGLAGISASSFGQGPGERTRRPRGNPDDYRLPADLRAHDRLSLVLGRVTGDSATVSLLAKETLEGYLEWGSTPGRYAHRGEPVKLEPGVPFEIALTGLAPDSRCFYSFSYRTPGSATYEKRPECAFHTQRKAGNAFVFAIQGDSHPERPQMSEPNLYARTLLTAAAANPDFYICMGDDFSVAPIREVSEESVAERYLLQRPFLGLIGQAAPLFLLNGNHEQASLFNYNQTDERHQVAVLAQNVRNRYFPTPEPSPFYSGDTASLPGIGLRKDYCAWTWGDALFVILDNYWHSPAQVDSGFPEKPPQGDKERHPEGKERDWWGITLGNEQYAWFKQTLERSTARYKFVFAHHVLGTTRGGVDVADLYEWGGRNKRGDWEFATQRPDWEMPVHQLMVKHRVTIFFQGHDHLYCQQEKDGIIYQEVPMPADHGYAMYNAERYGSGVKLPNSGHLRVSVSPAEVKVEYVSTLLPKDETADRKTGDILHSYTVKGAA